MVKLVTCCWNFAVVCFVCKKVLVEKEQSLKLQSFLFMIQMVFVRKYVFSIILFFFSVVEAGLVLRVLVLSLLVVFKLPATGLDNDLSSSQFLHTDIHLG